MDLSLTPRPARHLGLALGLGLAAAASGPAQAVFKLNDTYQPPADYDLRPGNLLPGSAQLAVVAKLGAGLQVNWNRFGTVQNMIRPGGFIATGFSGTPVDAARGFVLANRDLFKLSADGVANLELVNEGITPYNKAQAVLFRQKFGGMVPTQDAMIVVGIVDGKVYYVSSSSAGEQGLPSVAKISPSQAWAAVARDINRNLTVADITGIADKTATTGWIHLGVKGLVQDQLVRVAALPIPAGGVRQAYEVDFIDVQGARAQAYREFVDAETGKVLIREDHVLNQSAGGTTIYQTALASATECSPKTEFTVGTGIKTLAITAVAANPVNDIRLNLYYMGVFVTYSDTAVGTEAITYQPTGGVAAGKYQIESCPAPTTVSGSTKTPILPPFNVAGTITQSDQTTPAVNVSLPVYKWFAAFPSLVPASTASDADPLVFVTKDTRVQGCFKNNLTDTTGCNLILNNLAARSPWDVLPAAANTPSMTTTGNAAITAEAWASPLTPAEMYRPVAADRRYIYAFTNAWNASKCSPTGFVPGMGQDINVAIAQLFSVHNRMHDWAYFLGFTETNYNMQQSNFGLTSANRENDPEIGNTQAGAVDGGAPDYMGRDNANQIPEQDGVPGITNQYLFQSLYGAIYVPCADGDLDMGIVGHEYTHETSNRMIAGPDVGLSGAQGGAMGEAWSDQSAGEYMLAYGFTPVADDDPSAIGVYATGNKTKAIRDYSMADNPLNYSNFGFDTPGPEVHADGEIWNGTQWEIRTVLGKKYEAQFPVGDKVRQQDCADGKFPPDYCPGTRRWIQLSYDAFLLMQGAPSMLDARNAMLAADVARFGGANQKELWHVYAKRGMGQYAYAAGGADTVPVGEFSSPNETNGTVTFKVTGVDTKASIPAKVFVGQYTARTRPVADTDPKTVVDTTSATTSAMTMNLDETADMVPDTYDFVVTAPGYGSRSFKGYTITPGAQTITFDMPVNMASPTRGSTVLKTTATVAANMTNAPNLIDESEETGAIFGDAAPVAGKYFIVKLGKGAQVINQAGISNIAGPNNPGRFTGLRKFEILTCNGDDTKCVDPANFTKAFVSADDAFPSFLIRPVQPDLMMRKFDFPAVTASHVMLMVDTSQCTGQPLYNRDYDTDPLNDATCGKNATVPQPLLTSITGTVRTTDLQLFNIVPNLPPIARATVTPATATPGQTVTLDGSTSTDPDGTVVAYSWKQTGGPAVTLSDPTAVSPTFAAPSVTATTPLTFQLTVTDNQGATNTNADTNSVMVSVGPVANQLPLARATGPATATQGSTVTLDGTGSTDPDGTVASYSWKQTAGSPAVTLTGANTAMPSFTAPMVSSATPLTFQLTVTDNLGATNVNTDTNTVTVTITQVADQAPIANAGPDQTVPSETATVTLDGTASKDPDGNVAAYNWTQSSGPTVTLSNASTAHPTFTAPRVSNATPLVFKLTVTDNQGVNNVNTDTNSMTVTVTPKANQAPVANAGPAQAVNPGAAVTLDGTGSTDADGTIATYNWQQVGGSPTVTLTNANTAKPNFTAPTVGSATVLTFQLTVVDDQGAANANTTGNTVAITVTPATTPVTPTTPVSAREINAGRGGTGSGALPTGLLIGFALPALRRRRRAAGK